MHLALLNFLDPAAALLDGFGVGIPIGTLLGVWVARHADSAKRYLLEERDIDGRIAAAVERGVQRGVNAAADVAKRLATLGDK